MVETKIAKPSDIWLKKESLLARSPLIFIGLGIFALLYWASFYQADKSRAMFGYLFGFTFSLSLILGSMIFVLIQHVTRAGWSVVIRRIPETVIALSPMLIIFFIPIFLNIHEIFPWTHADHIDDILAKKLPYLNENFFYIRSFGYLLCWAVMGVYFYRISLAQDDNFNKSLTVNMQAVSAPAIFIFAITSTFASFDWLMSLQPHWYSTIFGVYFFAGCLLFALAFITLISLLLQSCGLLKSVVTDDHYHDLGKLLFGFTVFWAYIAFSQFMLYWYAGIPEEIEFYAIRLEHGFGKLSWAMPILHFFVPFFALMSRTLKKVKLVLAINCFWIILVHMIDIYWLIIPAQGHKATFSVAMEDVLSLLGIFFILFGCFMFLLSRRSLIAKGDPRLTESLSFENF